MQHKRAVLDSPARFRVMMCGEGLVNHLSAKTYLLRMG